MVKYWIAMIISTALGVTTIPLVPTPFVVPLYVLTALLVLISAFGLQDEVFRPGRGPMQLEGQAPANDPVASARRA